METLCAIKSTALKPIAFKFFLKNMAFKFPLIQPRIKERGLHLSCRLLHLFTQTERAHVRPDFLDVRQTLFFRAAPAGILPTRRVFPINRPDGILLFVIDYYFVDLSIFSLFAAHCVSPRQMWNRLKSVPPLFHRFRAPSVRRSHKATAYRASDLYLLCFSFLLCKSVLDRCRSSNALHLYSGHLDARLICDARQKYHHSLAVLQPAI